LILREGHKQKTFQKRVLRRMPEPKIHEAKGGWRKLHNEELHNLYTSPNIITTVKPRSMRWAGHVTRMGGIGMHTGFW
jgi:hypothetical protein